VVNQGVGGLFLGIALGRMSRNNGCEAVRFSPLAHSLANDAIVCQAHANPLGRGPVIQTICADHLRNLVGRSRMPTPTPTKTSPTESEVPELTATATVRSGRGTLQAPLRGLTGSGTALLPLTPKATEDTSHEEGAFTRHIGGEYVRQLWLTAAPLVVADLCILVLSIGAARQIVFLLGLGTGMDITASFLPIATGFLLISAELGLYPGIRLSPVEEFRRLAMSVTSMFAMWFVAVTILSGGLTVQRSLFMLLSYLFCLVSLPLCRGWARRWLAKWSWWGFPTLVCGDDSVAVTLHDWLATNRRLGLRPVGVIADPSAMEIDTDEPWYAGTWSEAGKIAKRTGAYWAVVVPPEGGSTAIASSITDHLSTIPHIHILSELTGLPDHWNRCQQFDGLAGIHLQQNLLLPLPRLTKRVMDITIAIVTLLFLSPLLLALAFAVNLSSRGPIIYGNERIGRGGKHFFAWKFRTMVQNADQVLEDLLDANPEMREEYERDHKLKRDPRITTIGRLMRKLSLDELPQLGNVIRGEMSLVGPRPMLTSGVDKYGEYFGLYTMVSPGITGLWQVSGRNNTTYEERVQLDAYYVRNWSPWMDLYLLIRTIRIVLFADGAY